MGRWDCQLLYASLRRDRSYHQRLRTIQQFCVTQSEHSNCSIQSAFVLAKSHSLETVSGDNNTAMYTINSGDVSLQAGCCRLSNKMDTSASLGESHGTLQAPLTYSTYLQYSSPFLTSTHSPQQNLHTHSIHLISHRLSRQGPLRPPNPFTYPAASQARCTTGPRAPCPTNPTLPCQAHPSPS
jgi:hypothetical protein